MTEIKKANGIILRKLDFQESSKIVHVFSDQFGKISVLIKGAKSGKSSIGKIIDTLNSISFVYYKKSTRELQILTEAELIEHFRGIRSDFDSMIYATAILELIERLIPAEEVHKRLFNGTMRILTLMSNNPNSSSLYFLKFLHFILDEIGYKLELENCISCGEILETSQKVGFNVSKGFVCQKCSENEIINFTLEMEQFKKLQCSIAKKNECQLTDVQILKFIELFENYLTYHIEDFGGIKSIKLIRK